MNAELPRIEPRFFDVERELKKLVNWTPHSCKPDVLSPLLELPGLEGSEAALVEVIKSALIERCPLCPRQASLSTHVEAASQFITRARSSDAKKYTETTLPKDPQSHLW